MSASATEVRSATLGGVVGALLLGAVAGAGLNNGAQSPGVRALNVQDAAEWLPLIAVVAVFGMAGALVGRVVATAAYGREDAVR